MADQPSAIEDHGAELGEVALVVFDFDGVFTDNTVIVSEDGRESVTCWRSDGLGLQRAASAGVGFAIVSTERNPLVTWRARKLRIPCLRGVEDKALAVRRLMARFKTRPEQTMFVGNDINDIPALGCVGWPVAVADAYAEVLPHVRCVTRRPGGRGAVREVCDVLFRSRARSGSRLARAR